MSGDGGWGQGAGAGTAEDSWGTSTYGNYYGASGGDGGASGGGYGGGSDNKACRICGNEGHFARECPDKPSRACYNCGEEGHSSRDCTKERKPQECRKCGGTDHLARECPTGGGGGDATCYNCGKSGHMKSECPEPPKVRRCYNCQQEGHHSKDCTNEPVEKPERIGEDGKPVPAASTYIPPTPTVNEEAFDEVTASGVDFAKFSDVQVSVTDPNFRKPLTNFDEAGLCEQLRTTMATAKYEKPTPIQQYALNIVSAGKDMIACAQTGSGKSAAFILPILQALINDPDLPARADLHGQIPQTPLVVVIAPTRELCVQIGHHFRVLSHEPDRRLGVTNVYGGTQVAHEKSQILSGTHIVSATPGRLKHCVDSDIISFSKVRYFVLDEADRMLDTGFQEVIRYFAQHPTMPKKEQRQTLMFSATFPSSVQALAQELLRPACVKVVVGILGGVCGDVQQAFHPVSKTEKRSSLEELLKQYPAALVEPPEPVNPADRVKIIVFIEKKTHTDTLCGYFSQRGYAATSIHSDRRQDQREQALGQFKRGKMAVLFATAVAARGLDIKGVTLVINYDLPKTIDEYVHRVGRTGRMGKQGCAISFYDEAYDSSLAPELVSVLTQCNQPIPDFISAAAGGGGGDYSYGGGCIEYGAGTSGYGDGTTPVADEW